MNDFKVIKQVHELLEQLSSSQISSLSDILFQLTDILNNLSDEKIYTASFSFTVFDTILNKYIKLFDNDEFIDAICHHYSIENNNFLRNLFHIIDHYDFKTVIKLMPIKTQRRICFSLFDHINSSITIRSYLQNYENINITLIHTCSFILYTVLKVFQSLNFKLTNNDLEKYQIFKLFITFIDEYFVKKEHLRINEKQDYSLIIEILHFIWDITCETSTIPIFINANCPQACLRWLVLPYLDVYEYGSIIHILKNIACHDQGTVILKKFQSEKILRQFKNEIFNLKFDLIIHQEKQTDIHRLLALLLVLVVEPDELYINRIDRDLINQVLLYTKTALTSPTFLDDNHYDISLYLIAIMKLCTNDNVIDYIFQQDQYPMYFLTILTTMLSIMENRDIDDDYLRNDVLAIMALANILWSISFHDRYKNDLIQNINLIKKLEAFRVSDTTNNTLPYIYIPYQMSSLRRSLDGIYQNLYPSLPSKIEIKSTNCPVMISYSHINIDFCRQLYDVLSKLPELTISIDINNGKYLWKEIAQTIQQSKVILVLISKEFFYSKSCRQELMYITDTMKKLFFPIFIDKDFKPTGWLHERITRLKYVRFGEKDFMVTCQELLSLINENLSMNISLDRDSLYITKWNDIKIKQWFTNNNIIPELYDFYHFHNGMELLLYAQATLAYPWTKEYERIRLRFEEKFKQQEQSLSEDQFLQFIYALKRL